MCPAQLFHYTPNDTCLTACPQPSYSATNASTGAQTCFDCPQYCTSCVSDSQCGGCETGTYSYANLCYLACPAAIPYAFNFACQSCNVVDCAVCSGADCDACASGKLLIGTTLCISSCSSLQVYNATTKTCDTVDTGGDGSTNGTTTTTTNTQEEIRLSFIPMPFLIGYLIVAVIVLLLHLRGKLSALSTLLGLVGPVLFVATATGLAVGLTSNEFTSTGLEVGSYAWVLGLLVCLVAGVACLRLWVTEVDCEKEVVVMLGVLFPSAYTLLAANIYLYNSYHIKDHRPFWRRYSLLLKLSLLALIPLIAGSVLVGFSTSDYSIYAFYAAIEVTILSALLGFLTLAWFWFPPPPPPEEEDEFTGISDKSQEQLDHPLQQEPESMNQIRIIDTKTEIVRPGSAETLPPPRPKTGQEYNAIKAVVRLSPRDIEEGLEKGVFRKEESQVVREMQAEEEASKIDHAQKLNDYLLAKEQERRQKENIFAQEESEDQESPRQPEKEPAE